MIIPFRQYILRITIYLFLFKHLYHTENETHFTFTIFLNSSNTVMEKTFYAFFN